MSEFFVVAATCSQQQQQQQQQLPDLIDRDQSTTSSNRSDS